MQPNPIANPTRLPRFLSSPRPRTLSFPLSKQYSLYQPLYSNKSLPLPSPTRPFSVVPTTHSAIARTTTMASDEDYTSFLEKANQPTGAATASTTSAISKLPNQADLPSQSSNIPPALKSLDVTFTSESDEPFEPFAVPYPGSSLPDAAEFAKVIKHEKGEGGVEELSVKDFDPSGEYAEVLEKVAEAARNKGEIRCFRVDAGRSTKVLYYVVGLDREVGRLVGVRAVSVES